MSEIKTKPRFRLNPEDPDGFSRIAARYVRNAAGLGTLLGGFLGMASYFAAGLLALPPAGRAMVALIPFVWIAGKEALRGYVHEALPGVPAAPTRLERKIHRISTVVVTVSCLGVLLFAVERLWGKTPPWQVYGSLLFTVAMPIMVWRFLRTTEELILGIFLMFQAVLLLAGRPSQLGSLIHIPVVAAVAMLAGAWQHHEFLALRRLADARAGRN